MANKVRLIVEMGGGYWYGAQAKKQILRTAEAYMGATTTRTRVKDGKICKRPMWQIIQNLFTELQTMNKVKGNLWIFREPVRNNRSKSKFIQFLHRIGIGEVRPRNVETNQQSSEGWGISEPRIVVRSVRSTSTPRNTVLSGSSQGRG